MKSRLDDSLGRCDATADPILHLSFGAKRESGIIGRLAITES